MTHNQIDLAKLKEEVRHNQEMESINKTTNDINQQHYLRADTVSQAQAAEQQRHNVVTEQQEWVQKAINSNQAAAAMAQAAASGLSAQAAMLNANTNALIAPSQVELNYANASLGYSKAEEADKHGGLYGAQTVGQLIENSYDSATYGTKREFLEAQKGLTQAQTEEAKQRAKTQRSQRVLNYSGVYKNYTSGQANAIQGLKGVVGLFK